MTGGSPLKYLLIALLLSMLLVQGSCSDPATNGTDSNSTNSTDTNATNATLYDNNGTNTSSSNYTDGNSTATNSS